MSNVPDIPFHDISHFAQNLEEHIETVNRGNRPKHGESYDSDSQIAGSSRDQHVRLSRHNNPDYYEDYDPGMSVNDSIRTSTTHVSTGDPVVPKTGDVTFTEGKKFKNFQSPSKLDELRRRISSYRTMFIILGVIVGLLLAGLIIVAVLLALGPCLGSKCVHGFCDERVSVLGTPACSCEIGWTGDTCNIQQIDPQNNTTDDSVGFSWETEVSETDIGFRVYHSEARYYPDEITMKTYDTSLVINDVKPGVNYVIEISSVSWDHVMTPLDSQQRYVNPKETKIEVTWAAMATTNNERGYSVRVSRVQKAQQGFVLLDKDARNVQLNHLDDCTSYNLKVVKIRGDYSEEIVEELIEQTVCTANGWRVGDSVLLGDWNGGANRLLSGQHCNQPDNFPPPVVSPSCSGSENTGNVGEAITADHARTGQQSWHYKRGFSGISSGCPYAPPLSLKAGRSDGNFSGDSDGFYASFWIQAANSSGDNSSVEIAGGNSVGIDRESSMVYATAYPSGLEIKTFDCEWSRCEAYKNCSYSWPEVLLAQNLPLSQWHQIEMEFQAKNDNYKDMWTYKVNGEYGGEVGAYLAAHSMEQGDGYNDYVNRIRFRPRHPVKDVNFQGFFFDDIYYKVFSWNDKENVLDYYETSFEL